MKKAPHLRRLAWFDAALSFFTASVYVVGVYGGATLFFQSILYVLFITALITTNILRMSAARLLFAPCVVLVLGAIACAGMASGVAVLDMLFQGWAVLAIAFVSVLSLIAWEMPPLPVIGPALGITAVALVGGGIASGLEAPPVAIAALAAPVLVAWIVLLFFVATSDHDTGVPSIHVLYPALFALTVTALAFAGATRGGESALIVFVFLCTYLDVASASIGLLCPD